MGKKKVVGLSFGRAMSNTEILIKEALIECEAQGYDIEFLNCEKMDIKPCRGCCQCVVHLMMGTQDGECFQKDDFHIILEAIYSADAVIMGAPVYVLAPSGKFKDFCDRIGPGHDITFVMPAIEKGQKEQRDPSTYPDVRALKKRVGALVSVGGARTENWTSLGLPNLFEGTLSMGIDVIDKINYYGAMDYDSVIGRPDMIARAKKMGENICEALRAQTEEERIQYRGDDEGCCPVCHERMLTITGKGKKVECPICGIEGELDIVDGELKASFSPEQILRSRLKEAGKWEHSNEIRNGAMTQIHVENLKEKKERYINVGKK